MGGDVVSITAIPTRYNGIQFRSRLEATWAAFFDRCGFAWEYEPIDIRGWIPDFALKFSLGELLVEAKPVMTPRASRMFFENAIVNADQDVLIVCACPSVSDGHFQVGSYLFKDRGAIWESTPATIEFCCCGAVSIEHYGSNKCCGATSLAVELLAQWKEAKNETQWRRPQ